MKKLTNKIAVTLGALVLLSGCTKLDEELYGSRYVDDGGTVSEADLNGVYTQLNGFSDQANLYALLEHPTDEMLGPTRGTDWDDFGIWRKLHQHSWDPSHGHVFETWKQLNTGVFRATTVIERSTDPVIQAEARFLRAFFMFYIVDLYGQAPFRDPDDSPELNPRVLNRQEATDFIIEDLKFAEANLTNGNPGKATKEGAQFLLAKVYLNRAVYTKPLEEAAGPYTFDPADLNNVIAYADAVINSGKFQLASRYYDNFKWDNSTASRELIFVRANEPGVSQNANAENRTRMVLHYNNTPDGWNGFTTLADFYNSFEDGDQRKYSTIEENQFTQRTGLNGGFLAGQAYGPNATPLKDRSGQPLIFTPEVDINYATEAQGIRAIKYPLDPGNFSQSGNDYVFFRYSDLLLMKAEAQLRLNNPGPALAIVNEIRTLRGATPLGTLDEAALLAERGRELYWEGWRRNDLIRFGRFNEPTDQRPTASAGFRVLYPIPQRAVDTNPNLVQNPGY